MRASSSSSSARGLVAAAALISLLQPAVAHSWVEQLNRIATNGTMINPAGFIRQYTGHGDPGFSDSLDVNLIPPNGRANGKVVEATDLMCASQQKIGAYSAKYPKLTTAPGDLVALRYQENGHVTLPQNQANKPLNRGTVYIYGTEKPSDSDTLLAIHNVWTEDGSGGDKRGKLLSTRNFDDGQCYQVNSGAISTLRQAEFKKVAEGEQGADIWCQADLQLPSDLTIGSDYTLYWVWDWPTLVNNQDPNSKVAVPEIYTSCMDLAVVDACDNSLGSVKSPLCTTSKSASAVKFSAGQDLNTAAIASQLVNNFAVAVNGSTSGTDFQVANTTSSTTSSTAAPTTTGPVVVPAPMVTVTVTDAMVTVYATTVTVPASGLTTSTVVTDSTTMLPTGVPAQVSPFLTARSMTKGRRMA